MKNPRITVCIPVYNSAPFLAAAIESVLDQSYADFELLIVDDCSSDGSREIIRDHAARDRRIVALFNDNNLGMVENWNACIDRAQGEYVKFLFGDDLLASPDALRKMVAVLEAEPGVSLVACARNIIDDNARNLKVSSSFPDGMFKKGEEMINLSLFMQKNLNGEPSAVMFRKSQAGRRFDVNYRQLVDLEMWFHLLERGYFFYIAEPLVSFRLHAGQQTKKNVRELVHVEEMIRLLGEYGEKPYARLGRATRGFLRYYQNYRIWKAYKNGRISRDRAVADISRRCPLALFLALIPLYKVVTPVWKLKCHFDKIEKN